MNWTTDQRQVIEHRNGNLLVSAAAGSGKTAVLVEHVLEKVLGEGVDIDRLLIVTFTRAAADQMRDRIRRRLEEALEADPDNVHLQRQLTLVHHAHISTIDSFCSYVLHNYFHILDIDPTFRMAEEGELALLKNDVLTKLLEDCYETGDDAFHQMTEFFSDGKNDQRLEELVLRLYEFSASHPAPVQWLRDCGRMYQCAAVEELEQTVQGRLLLDQLQSMARDAGRKLSEAKKLIEKKRNGLEPYRKAVEADLATAEKLAECSSLTKWYEYLKEYKPLGLKAIRKEMPHIPAAKERCKEYREQGKDALLDIRKNYFTVPPEQWVAQMAESGKTVEELIRLTIAFAEAYGKAKKDRNIMDFSDLEHFALEIFTGEDGQPSQIARQFAQYFEEILIDEYQDSNLLQEKLLGSISREKDGTPNLFMVGDVKQSIYRFRQARPELFAQKLYSYKKEGPYRVVNLHENFRSRRQVLDSVNSLFRKVMLPAVGGIVYDDAAALYPGAEFPETDAEPSGAETLEPDKGNLGTETPETDGGSSGTEVSERKRIVRDPYVTEVLHFSEPDLKHYNEEHNSRVSREELEGAAIAEKIYALTDPETGLDIVGEDGNLRKVRYGDIVILLRSRGQYGDTFVRVLVDHGIPACTESVTGFYQAMEVQTMIQLLQVLDNIRQDIPLAGVMRSYIGQFADRELAWIKGLSKERARKEKLEKQQLYDDLLYYRDNGPDHALRDKIGRFLERMDTLRDRVSFTPIHRLIWQIYEETGYYDYVRCLPGGQVRKANLDKLAQQARAYENTSYKGLFHFVRYLRQLEKYDQDTGEAAAGTEAGSMVRIMTIHKSKGLEFPVVFAAGLGRKFNKLEQTQPVLMNEDLGIVMDYVDPGRHIRVRSPLRKMFQRMQMTEEMGEALRILYVAMTRAKEKLILTCLHTEKKEVLREKVPVFDTTVLEAGNFWDLVRCMGVPGSGYVFRQLSPETVLADMAGRMAAPPKAASGDIRAAWETAREALLARMDFVYPYPNTSHAQKVSVSELKKRRLEETMDVPAQELFAPAPPVPLIPDFAGDPSDVPATSRGDAYHKFLQHFPFGTEYVRGAIAAEKEQLVGQGVMERRQAEVIREDVIERFVRSPLGQRMAEADKKGLLYREQPFVTALPVREVFPQADPGEPDVLIQGIIDAYFVEDGRIVVVDYKTDRIRQPEKLRDMYRLQLQYYGQALARLTGLPVKEQILYSFAMGREISVEAGIPEKQPHLSDMA